MSNPLSIETLERIACFIWESIENGSSIDPYGTIFGLRLALSHTSVSFYSPEHEFLSSLSEQVLARIYHDDPPSHWAKFQ
jgi:hypothetical protein